jgi:hypothetical protein
MPYGGRKEGLTMSMPKLQTEAMSDVASCHLKLIRDCKHPLSDEGERISDEEYMRIEASAMTVVYQGETVRMIGAGIQQLMHLARAGFNGRMLREVDAYMRYEQEYMEGANESGSGSACPEAA